MKTSTEIAAFDSSWDPDTVLAVFDESVKLQSLYPEWSDAIDRKVVTIFTLATAIAATAPSLLAREGALTRIGLACIAIAWLAAVIACYAAYGPRAIRVGPSPQILLDKLWMGRSPTSYRYYRIRDMGKTFNHNRDQVNTKARWLSRAMIATVFEVLFLLFAYSV